MHIAMPGTEVATRVMSICCKLNMSYNVLFSLVGKLSYLSKTIPL